VILSQHSGDNSIIAFHCQQAAEKAIKGFLLKETDSLFDAHSLIYLCKKASKLNSKYNSFLKDCAYLNQFYIETRYPADDPIEIDDSEMEECMRIAKEILETALSENLSSI
jgi:HEPN domain-containing protein